MTLVTSGWFHRLLRWFWRFPSVPRWFQGSSGAVGRFLPDLPRPAVTQSGAAREQEGINRRAAAPSQPHCAAMAAARLRALSSLCPTRRRCCGGLHSQCCYNGYIKIIVCSRGWCKGKCYRDGWHCTSGISDTVKCHPQDRRLSLPSLPPPPRAALVDRQQECVTGVRPAQKRDVIWR